MENKQEQKPGVPYSTVKKRVAMFSAVLRMNMVQGSSISCSYMTSTQNSPGDIIRMKSRSRSRSRSRSGRSRSRGMSMSRSMSRSRSRRI